MQVRMPATSSIPPGDSSIRISDTPYPKNGMITVAILVDPAEALHVFSL